MQAFAFFLIFSSFFIDELHRHQMGLKTHKHIIDQLTLFSYGEKAPFELSSSAHLRASISHGQVKPPPYQFRFEALKAEE